MVTIVQYAAPIEAGPVDYAGVQQALHDAAHPKKNTTWEEAIAMDPGRRHQGYLECQGLT